MPSPTNIETPILYSFEIYPFSDPLRTQTIILVNNTTKSFRVPSSVTNISDFYYLDSFSFENDVFNPIQTGTAKVVQQQYEKIDFFQYVAEGDLIFIKENGNNIFSGYIESLQLDISMNGTTITINFVNFLKQLSVSKVFGLIFDTIQPAQGISMQDFLDTITGNTLIGIALDVSTLFTFELYQGRGEDSSVVLTDASTIYVGISSFMTILQAINKILYPYQRLIYQDSGGNIAIAPLSLFDDHNWLFQQRNFSSSRITIPHLNISVKKNAAGIPNYQYATLFTIPTAQGLLGGDQSQLNSSFFCQYIPPASNFNRLLQLYNSTNFTIADVIIEDLITDPAKIDITLNNISDLLQGGVSTSKAAAITIASVNMTPISQAPIRSSDNVDVSAILFNYAARAMAEHLVDETSVIITSMRIKQIDFNGNLLPLPINRLVDIAMDDGILEKSSLFCRGYSLVYSAASGAMVSLNCTKPLVGGAYWVNGELISV